ncbi:MAG TPA: hypothetical protein DIU15_19285 [Deltaproteobacteria bacterium]|nr:hypothetical protein [Deltaproteobacteria bacterium]HCP48191.1 hypothetical protein [Deltaproteobacteria bacterium]
MDRPLLLMGYGAFGAWEHNSTVDVTAQAAVELQRSGIPVRRHIADVSLARLPQLLDRLLDEGPVAGILATGLSGRSADVEVECRALNRAHFTFPDIDGYLAEDGVLLDGAASILETHSDVAALSSALSAAGIAHRLSTDAGTYLCNAMYFHSLLRMQPRGLPALFLHLPPLPGAALKALERNPRAAVGDVSMPLEVQVAAVVAVATTLVGRVPQGG